jgi:peptidoglycan/LPS O-acetylase OafA/YrhL
VGAGDFFLRRAGRLVPAHLMMVAAFVVLVLATSAAGVRPQHPEWLQWDQLPGQVFLLTALGVGGQGWNSPTWSLSALLVCYLGFPPLWRGLLKLRRPAAILGLAVLAMTAGDLLARRLLGLPVYELQQHVGALRAIPLFVFGAALAALGRTFVIRPRTAKLLTIEALALLVEIQLAGRFDFISILVIGVMVLAAGAVPVKNPSKVLEKAALVSFALFITSELVRTVFFGVDHAVAARLHFGPQVEWGLWFASLAAAVAFAVGFHYLVDWPSQAWMRRWIATEPAKAKARLASLLPVPDPDFDPFRATRAHAPRVREIVLQIGPVPGAAHRGLEGPSGLAWG